MRLTSIEVHNFRQFHGAHRLDLGITDAKNVVVIHGENGAGKTTLLNAFKWCFYGQTDFDTGAENLLNEQALTQASVGESIEAYVTVQFQHESLRYTATRKALFKKNGPALADPVGDSGMTLSWIDSSGAARSSNKPEVHMNQILPAKMQPYFFFNGERIEKLARASAADQVQDAIKNLMGLEIWERAMRHVGGPAITQLRKELKEASNTELADAIDKENLMLAKVEETRANIIVVDKNSAQLNEEIGEINKRLESFKSVAALQGERLQLEEDVRSLEAQIRATHKRRFDYVSAFGGLAFTERLIETASSILDEKRKKGELPFKVKEQFIADLLEQGRCICERDLAHGTPAYAAVNAFRSSTTSADVETAFIETSGALVHMKRDRLEIAATLLQFQNDEVAARQQIEAKHDRIEVINKEIGGSRESEDIPKLELRRASLMKSLVEAAEKKGALKGDLQNWEIQLAELTRNRERLSAQTAKNAHAAKRLKMAEEVHRVLVEFYEALAEQVRDELSKRVNETFQRIMRKEYWAEIDKDYTLQIFKDVGGTKQPVPEKSTGESQITSLSFIASIVAIAKSKAGSSIFLGGVFPIVMDSPFGALDPDYRKKIAEFIPQLADQVVVLVSDSQWKDEVGDQIGPRMARDYTLRYFKPTVPAGGDLSNVPPSDRFESTTVEEGHHVR